MTIKEKLQIIMSISGLNQESLAQKLGVTFAAFNRWINDKSNPYQRNIIKIDELYLELTGQKIIPESVLQSKKLFIKSKSKNLKTKVLDLILKRNDIYEDLVLNVTYHTNNIEGSTLTKGETQDILFDHNMKINKSIKEVLEAKNHQIAFDYLLEHLSKNKKINEILILKLHSILMNGILPNAGQYRNHAVRIVGSNVPAANYLSIQKLMNQLFKNINIKTDDIVYLISKTHAEFERIHPFSDGNGRIGRLLLISQLLSHNLPPAIIKKEYKHSYYSYLAKAQSKEEYSSLEDFICDAIILGFEMLE